MRHVIDEKPALPDDLHGRLLYTARYVDDKDLTGKDAINIGCGHGWFELYAMSKGVSSIVGVEPTEEDLGVARKYVGAPSATFTCASGLDLPFPSGSFDSAFCWEVLEHLPKSSEDRFFSEVRRILKRGGVFYLSTPCRSLVATVSDPARWLIGHRHYLPNEVSQFASRNGFEPMRVTAVGRVVEVLAKWNLYVSKWVFHRKPFLQHHFQCRCDHEIIGGRGYTNVFLRMIAV